MGTFRQILPRPLVLVVAAIILATAYLVKYMGEFAAEMDGRAVPAASQYLIVGYAIIACVLYGGWRLLKTFPPSTPGYFEWLQQTPWTLASDRPLPLGPIRLVWQDALIPAILAGLVWGDSPLSMWWIPTAVLSGYLLMATMIFALGSEVAFAMSLALGGGFVVILWRHPAAACAVAFVLYVNALSGHERMWRRCPWSRSIRERLLRLQSRRDGRSSTGRALAGTTTIPRLRWPFHQTAPQKLSSTPRKLSLAISLLCGWWCFVVTTAFGERPPDKTLRVMLLGCALLLPFARWAGYRIGFAPPLGLYARIRTGRWWIPGYDTLLTQQLVFAIAGVVLALGLEVLGVPPALRIALCISAGVFALLALRPSPSTWWLTGHHCIARWAPTATLRNPTGVLQSKEERDARRCGRKVVEL